MTFKEANDIINYAAHNALQVAGDPAGCGLTDYGIASCAAATALVLTDPTHPNHSRVRAQMEAQTERAA